MTSTAHSPREPWWLAVFAAGGLCLLLAGLNAKLLVDGYASHAVGVQLRIARYAWLTGDPDRAAAQMWRTAPTALEAGVRWQVAQGYLYLSQAEGRRGDRERAASYCREALRMLGFGRFDRSGTGTSRSTRRCDEFR